MIPKIIHYCWLSDDPYPEKIQRCLDTWKKYLPDYEFMLWDLKRFPLEKSVWVKEAFESKKYAFAADYIRSYALYNYGGIYLDSDVEVLKPFDDLLELPYFFGRGNSAIGIEAATCGSEKGFPLFADLLAYYDGRHFIKEDGSLDMLVMPEILRKTMESKYRMKSIASIDEFIDEEGVINLFPADYFSPISWETKHLDQTENTYSIHHYVASWHTRTDEFKLWLHRVLGHKLYHKIAMLIKR